MLRHDKSTVYRPLLLTKYMSIHRIPILLQHFYSPDLAPCDFFLGFEICLKDNDSHVPNNDYCGKSSGRVNGGRSAMLRAALQPEYSPDLSPCDFFHG
ncbi:hypothetical protein AVEN_142013-1 [Araneus ventricosus]|uniref:Uncharacterized protein n=1 Tax=Araneus ventricosus TaxID=182803 RepID=A0A4Y2MB56_ARAVE|nr:hypothetical protein AVEN_142013-1 [Araneus ventricosus]